MVLPIPKLVFKLFLAGQLKWKEGEISFLGQPVTFVPYIFFKELHKELKKNLGEKAKDIMYLAGWVSGYENSKRIFSLYKVNDLTTRYKIAMDFVEISGVGEYKTLRFIPGKLSHFVYKNNPYGKIFYPAKEEVCHFIRGANAGGGTWVHKKLVIGIEIDCAAKNGKVCEFINIAYDDKELFSMYKEYLKRQFYDLKYVLKFKIKYIKEAQDSDKIEVPSNDSFSVEI